jgi:hypothetical protein
MGKKFPFIPTVIRTHKYIIIIIIVVIVIIIIITTITT